MLPLCLIIRNDNFQVSIAIYLSHSKVYIENRNNRELARRNRIKYICDPGQLLSFLGIFSQVTEYTLFRFECAITSLQKVVTCIGLGWVLLTLHLPYLPEAGNELVLSFFKSLFSGICTFLGWICKGWRASLKTAEEGTMSGVLQKEDIQRMQRETHAKVQGICFSRSL